jgi:hypothetical protein
LVEAQFAVLGLHRLQLLGVDFEHTALSAECPTRGPSLYQRLVLLKLLLSFLDPDRKTAFVRGEAARSIRFLLLLLSDFNVFGGFYLHLRLQFVYFFASLVVVDLKDVSFLCVWIFFKSFGDRLKPFQH